MDNQITLRRVTQQDLDSFRAIRLEALQQHPRAYGQTYDEESVRPNSYFSFLIGSNVVMGAFVDEVLVGYAILSLYNQRKMNHKGQVWGTYVKPQYARWQLAKKLMLRLVEIAKAMGLRYCHSSFFASNESGRRLHAIMGCIETYREKDGVRHLDGTYDDIVHLVKYL